MSCVLLQSSSHESQLSCHVCQYRSYLCYIKIINQATRVSSMSRLLGRSSSHESQLSCHVCQDYHQATRVSCHDMCVSIDLISVTLRSYMKSRKLAVMSCVLVLSSRHEGQLSCPVCYYSHQATRVSCHVMCVSTVIKPRELAVMSWVLVLSSSHDQLAVMSRVLVLSILSLLH